MQKRRVFLRQAGAFALGSLLLPSCMTGTDKNESEKDSSGTAAGSTTAIGGGNLGPIGVQLWSVKDVLEKDVPGTLQQLAAIGYKRKLCRAPAKKGITTAMIQRHLRKCWTMWG